MKFRSKIYQFIFGAAFIGLIFSTQIQESEAQITLPASLSVNQTDVDNTYKALGFALQHRFFQPADTLTEWGWELAIEANVAMLSSDAQASIAKFNSSGTTLSILPVPKIQFAIGLPLDFEFGIGWLGGIQDLSIWSFGVVRTWLNMEVFKVDSRAGLGFSSLSNFSSTNWNLEGIISFPLGIIEPYAILGVGGASVSLGGLIDSQITSLAGISTEGSYTSAYLGLGVPFMFGVFQLRPELMYFTVGELNVGARLAFVF